MVTLFAMAQIFPTLSPRAQEEFVKAVVQEVVWDAAGCKLRISLKPETLRQRFEALPSRRTALKIAEVLCEHLFKFRELKQLT